jgi:hypothetical protein
MHRLGASFFITRWPANHKLLEPAGQFGTHHVYRFVKPLPPAVQVEGPGRADIVRWSDEERIFKVSDTTAESRLVLAMSPYPKWHAYQGDQKLSLSSRNVGSVPLVMVSGLTNGELRLVYRDTPAEKAAGIAGLLAFLLCAVGLVVRPRSIVRLPPERTLRRVYLGLSIATLGSLLALPLVANLAGRRGQRAEWLAAEPAGAAIEDVLHQRLPDALSHHPALYCVEPYSRSPGWDCTESELRPVLSAADARGNRVPSCLLLGVPPAGRTVVGYDMPGSPNVLVGRLDNTGEGAGIIGSLTFDDKHSPAILIAGKRFRANVPPGTRRASITLENASRSASQICLELVSLAGARPSSE